jgi:hypothetical protein
MHQSTTPQTFTLQTGDRTPGMVKLQAILEKRSSAVGPHDLANLLALKHPCAPAQSSRITISPNTKNEEEESRDHPGTRKAERIHTSDAR